MENEDATPTYGELIGFIVLAIAVLGGAAWYGENVAGPARDAARPYHRYRLQTGEIVECKELGCTSLGCYLEGCKGGDIVHVSNVRLVE